MDYAGHRLFFGGYDSLRSFYVDSYTVHILSFYVIVTGAGWGKAWSIFHAFDFSAIQRAIWSSLWGDRLFFEEDMFGRFQQSYWVGRQSRACSGQLIAGLRHAVFLRALIVRMFWIHDMFLGHVPKCHGLHGTQGNS